VSFGLHVVFLFLIFLVPPSNSHLVFDPTEQSSRFFKYMITVPEQKLSELPKVIEKNQPDGDAANPGMRHEGDEGKAGKRDAPVTNKRYAIKKIKDTMEPHMARPMSKDMVRTSGILAVLSAQNAPTSPFGQAIANGLDPENALGDLRGNSFGDSFGYGSLGINGTGRGSGGPGTGTIGVGKIKRLGTGDYGRNGTGKLTGRKPQGPKVHSRGGAVVLGSLSKDVIRRVIRRHLNEVSFCYEQGLAKRPNLTGRVAIRFTISSSGAVHVAIVSSSTLGDQQVEQCIARTIGRIGFPQPKGGGVVIVTYPFDLTSSEN
jgi:hypothetical protein